MLRMMATRRGRKKEDRESVLGQLKFPLVFFGLGLLVTEATFGSVLLRGNLDAQTSLIFGYLMAALFFFTILVVGVLTYIAPTHLMLLPQNDNELKEATAVATKFLQRVFPGTNSTVAQVIEALNLFQPEEEHS